MTQTALIVLSDVTFPPIEGLHQQSIMQVARLSRLGYSVSMVAYVRDRSRLDEQGLRDHLAGIQIALVDDGMPSLLRGLMNLARLGSGYRRLRRWRKSADGRPWKLVHLDGAAAAGLADQSLGPTVVSLVDSASLRWSRMAQEATSYRARILSVILRNGASLLENVVLRRSAYTHVVSTSDASWLQDRYGRTNVVSLPVAMPLSCERLERVGIEPHRSRPVQVILYADLRRSHMLSGARSIADEVLKELPDDPAWELTVLGRISNDSGAARVLDLPDATFLDWVDDYITFLAGMDIVVLPDTVGTGIKNRAVQSMALGLACVGSSVAFEGIEGDLESSALVEDDLATLRLGIEKLIGDRNERARMGSSARTEMLGRYSESVIDQRWRELYSQASDV